MERVPINHTIFTSLCEQINEQNKPLGIEPINAKEALLSHFQSSCNRY